MNINFSITSLNEDQGNTSKSSKLKKKLNQGLALKSKPFHINSDDVGS